VTVFGVSVSTPVVFMHGWGALKLLFELHECEGQYKDMISSDIVHMLCQSTSFLTAMTGLPVLEPMAIKYTKYQLSIG